MSSDSRNVRFNTLPLCALAMLFLLSTASTDVAWTQTTSSERGWMGLYIRDLDAQDIRALGLPTTQHGVVVSGVDDEGPAASVGIEPGDVIVTLEGQRIDSRAAFVQTLGDRRVGDRIRMQVVRQRTTRNVDLQLQARPPEMQGPAAIPPGNHAAAPPGVAAALLVLGLDDANLARYFGATDEEGVLLLRVEGSGLEGLRAGDVILEVDGVAVRSRAELQARWQTTPTDAELRLQVLRNRRTRLVRLPTEAIAASQVWGPEMDAPRVADGQQRAAWDSVRREIQQMRQRLQELEAQVDSQVRR